MCGRFSASKPDEKILRKFVPFSKAFSLGPRYNIAPSQMVAGVRLNNAGEQEFTMLKWGLLPSWAKDPKIAWTLVNARCETVKTKPAFRDAFKRRRCLILADGFYEWAKSDDGKHPFYFCLKNREPFAFAGLWEAWKNSAGENVETCAIITCEANEIVKPVHGRMPAILPDDTHRLWLDPKTANGDILLLPYPADGMESFSCVHAGEQPEKRNAGMHIAARGNIT